jgi:hypothetical protein
VEESESASENENELHENAWTGAKKNHVKTKSAKKREAKDFQTDLSTPDAPEAEEPTEPPVEVVKEAAVAAGPAPAPAAMPIVSAPASAPTIDNGVQIVVHELMPVVQVEETLVKQLEEREEEEREEGEEEKAVDNVDEIDIEVEQIDRQHVVYSRQQVEKVTVANASKVAALIARDVASMALVVAADLPPQKQPEKATSLPPIIVQEVEREVLKMGIHVVAKSQPVRRSEPSQMDETKKMLVPIRRNNRAKEAAYAAALVAADAAREATECVEIAEVACEHALNVRLAKFHGMLQAMETLWKQNRVENQRWNSHHCPSCAIYRLLAHWGLPKEILVWPGDMEWLSVCTCNVDDYVELVGMTRTEWSAKFRGVRFVDFYKLIFGALPAFLDGRGLAVEVGMSMMPCHRVGTKTFSKMEMPQIVVASDDTGTRGVQVPALPNMASQAKWRRVPSKIVPESDLRSFSMYTAVPSVTEERPKSKHGYTGTHKTTQRPKSRVYVQHSMDDIPGFSRCIGVDPRMRVSKRKGSSSRRKKNGILGIGSSPMVSKSYVSPQALLRPPSSSQPAPCLPTVLARPSSAGAHPLGSTASFERAMSQAHHTRLRPMTGKDLQSLRPSSAKLRPHSRNFAGW